MNLRAAREFIPILFSKIKKVNVKNNGNFIFYLYNKVVVK